MATLNNGTASGAASGGAADKQKVLNTEERSLETVRRIAKELKESDKPGKTKEQFLEEIDEFCPVLDEHEQHQHSSEMAQQSVQYQQTFPSDLSALLPIPQPAAPAESASFLHLQGASPYQMLPTDATMAMMPHFSPYSLNPYQPNPYPLNPAWLLSNVAFVPTLYTGYQVPGGPTQHQPQAVAWPFTGPIGNPNQPQPESIPTYLCKACQEFSTHRADLLEAHVLNKHMDELIRAYGSGERFPCFKCGETFATEEGEDAHNTAGPGE